MENYIINNNTIAIMKKGKKTIIYDVEKIRVINKSINRVLNENCNFYGSNLDGRRKSAKKILNIQYKVPIILDNNIILLQLANIRNEECLFLVLNKIVDYTYNNGELRVLCINNRIFFINVSKDSFEKMLINAIKLNNFLKWKKNINFV